MEVLRESSAQIWTGGVEAMRDLLRDEIRNILTRASPVTPFATKPWVVFVVGRQRRRQDHDHRQAGPSLEEGRAHHAALRGRHVPRRRRRAARDLGRSAREPPSIAGRKGRTLRRCSPTRLRAAKQPRPRRRPRRYRGPPAHQGQPDGRAGQDGARGRTRDPGSAARDAARARRHRGLERPQPGTRVRQGGGRDGPRASPSSTARPRAESRWRWCASSACPSATREWGRRWRTCSPSIAAAFADALVGDRRALSAEQDSRWMARALELARRGLGETNPNPMVGCVLVKAGRVVGEGLHRQRGRPARRGRPRCAAPARARGAPPPTSPSSPARIRDARRPARRGLLRAGVRRVVAAMRDPNPLVNGRGLAFAAPRGPRRCSAAPRADEAAALNERFVVAARLAARSSCSRRP